MASIEYSKLVTSPKKKGMKKGEAFITEDSACGVEN